MTNLADIIPPSLNTIRHLYALIHDPERDEEEQAAMDYFQRIAEIDGQDVADDWLSRQIFLLLHELVLSEPS